MNLGKCASCNQVAELHEDYDHKAVCENCLLGKKPKPLRQPELRIQQSAGNRDKLIDFIVQNASQEWVAEFIETELSRYRDELSREMKWVPLLEKQENTRVLLRMACLIGYREPILARPDEPVPEKKKAGRPKKQTVLGKDGNRNEMD